MTNILSVSSNLAYIGYICVAILILLLMVTIHEFGHYIAGKMLKFKINEFAVGFGPKLIQKTKKNGEKFTLRLIPLGGYCAFEGENEDGTEKPESFNNQKPWKRLIVLFFGAFFNFLSAIIFSFIFLLVAYKFTFWNALIKCIPFTLDMAWQILVVLGQLLTGKLSIKALGGPVTTIGTIASYTQTNWLYLLLFLPFISVNLAVFNLLPIPALDGFQMIFVLIEWIRKKPVKRSVVNTINNVGLIVLLCFVVLVDILQFTLWVNSKNEIKAKIQQRLTWLAFFVIISNMNETIDILDKLYEGLKFRDAVYSEKTNKCTANFLYNPEFFKPNEDNKNFLIEKLNKIVGDYVDYEINYISCPLDKRAIANYTYTTIVNNFPALSKNFTYDDVSVSIDGIKVELDLKLSPTNYDYAVGLNREQLVADKLKDSFLADFSVKFIKKEDEIEASEDAIKNNVELMSSIKEAEEKTVFVLENVTNIFGKTEASLAIDFSKITSPVENVIICGEVSSAQKKSYKRQQTKNGETIEIEKHFINFSIKNQGKVMYCSYFPKQAEESKLDLIEPGLKICTLGSFREFNSKLNFTCQTIARCEFKKEEIKSNLKHVNENYHTVFPQKYIDYEQSGLFDEEIKDVPGVYVVFDLETTGLEAAKDEIIEFGACKIVHGRIDETFSSFVKPNKHIPKEITTLTGITDDMVKDAPTINYVMPDFYKFCDGATLVGHNVAFDLGFVKVAGKKLSYDLSHQTMDTMEMARTKLPGLKNYKLGTVVDTLGVVLDNAHRAINDATATAKVFLKLL